MARNDHGLPKISLGPAMPYPSTQIFFTNDKSRKDKDCFFECKFHFLESYDICEFLNFES
jgi:hypothetical protein